MCIVSGCPVCTPPSIFWNSFQKTEITTISQMRLAVMSSNSFAIAKSATAELKMKMETLPAGFLVALCGTAIQSCDRHSKRSFLLLRIADLVVDAVDVVDVSVSVLLQPCEHLAFSGITYTPGITVSSLMFLLHDVFLSFLIRQKRELTLRMSFCHSFYTNLSKFRRC